MWCGVARCGAVRSGVVRSGVVVGAGGGRRWVPGGRGRPERRRPRYHFLKKIWNRASGSGIESRTSSKM